MNIKEKNNKGLIWLIVVLIVLVLGLGGFIVYDKLLNKDSQENVDVNSTTINPTQKVEETKLLTKEELEDIEIFINKYENYAFVIFDYDNPNNILKEYDYTRIGNPGDNLAYSIREKYKTRLTEEEIELISKEEEFFGETNTCTIEEIQYFLKEKTNKIFDKETIHNAFSEYYYKEIDKYVFYMTDTIFEEKFNVKSGYKKGDKYFVKINNSDLVLIYDNNQYYFYSNNLNY